MPSGLAVATEDFPRATSGADLLRHLVNYAVLAPSGHNSQPWLFKIREQTLALIADRTRALPVVDPYDRALTISCGAALEHLVIAARHFRHRLIVEELPSADPDHLATLWLGGNVGSDPRNEELFQAIPHRRTTRLKYEQRMLSAACRNACRDLTRERGVELSLAIGDRKRKRLADLVVEGDRAQFADPRFRRELAAWVHSRRSASRDGMSGSSFGMPDVLSPVGALVIRTFDVGKGVAAGDREKILRGSPVLGVFSTQNDRPSDWLATGRALARVLLKLTACGATGAFLNQPIEVERLRPSLRKAIGTTGMPQLLLRFGYGPQVCRAARRRLDDVLI